MAGFAQIGRRRAWRAAFAAVWADATCLGSYSPRVGRGAGREFFDRGRGGCWVFVDCGHRARRVEGWDGRGAGRVAAVRRRRAVGMADRSAPPGRAAVSGAAHPLLGRPPRHRHRSSGRPRRRTRRRHGALRRNGRRPRRALDLARGRTAVELRAGIDCAEDRRRRAPRRRGRDPAARTLLEPVPALRGASRRRVRVAADLPGRGAAVGAAADAAGGRGFVAGRGCVGRGLIRCGSVRRAGAPSCSSL